MLTSLVGLLCACDPPTPRIVSIDPETGPVDGGTLVKIKGVSFSASDVFFGAKPGTVTFLSSDVITVITPAASASGSVDVRVVNKRGSSSSPDSENYEASLPNGFLYVGSDAVDAGRSFCTGVYDGGAAPSACPASAARFYLSDPGDGGPGQGLISDLNPSGADGGTGGLPGVWIRYPLLSGAQAAAAMGCAMLMPPSGLPTKDEALSIAGANADSCLWPTCWTTWTSTPGTTANTFWVVGSDGSAWESSSSMASPALCITHT